MKTKIILFIIFGLLIIAFGFWQIRSAIYAPFKLAKYAKPPTTEEVLAALKSQDTDKDGLNDFDEKFVYQTSPYLTDSDSDGFSDKDEITAKTNPLDPKSTPENKILTTETPLEEMVFEAPSIGTSEPAAVSGGEVSVQEIKDLLVTKGGLSKDLVDKLDDNTLKKLYNETKKETGIDLNTLETPNDLLGRFSNLDVQQLRQLLISQGIDPKMLEGIDDETLKSLFLQALQQQPTQP